MTIGAAAVLGFFVLMGCVLLASALYELARAMREGTREDG